MSVLSKTHLLLTLSGILLVAGCGGAGSKDPSGYSTSAEMSAVQNLTPEERTIATRICYAYKSKSSSFRGQNYNGGTFNFNIDSRSCDDVRASYSVVSILQGSDSSTVYTTESDKPFKTAIQTSTSGYLVQLCTKIQNNQVISNTTSQSTMKIQVNFFRDSLDSYTLRYFYKTDSGAMKISSAETFKVRTQYDLTGTQILGMDEKYTTQQSCTTDGKYSEFNQTFSSFSK